MGNSKYFDEEDRAIGPFLCRQSIYLLTELPKCISPNCKTLKTILKSIFKYSAKTIKNYDWKFNK